MPAPPPRLEPIIFKPIEEVQDTSQKAAIIFIHGLGDQGEGLSSTWQIPSNIQSGDPNDYKISQNSSRTTRSCRTCNGYSLVPNITWTQ